MSAGMLAEIFGPDGLIVIAVVVIVLLFGGTQLPKLARGLGSASHEFKKGMEHGDPDGEGRRRRRPTRRSRAAAEAPDRAVPASDPRRPDRDPARAASRSVLRRATAAWPPSAAAVAFVAPRGGRVHRRRRARRGRLPHRRGDRGPAHRRRRRRCSCSAGCHARQARGGHAARAAGRTTSPISSSSPSSRSAPSLLYRRPPPRRDGPRRAARARARCGSSAAPAIRTARDQRCAAAIARRAAAPTATVRAGATAGALASSSGRDRLELAPVAGHAARVGSRSSATSTASPAERATERASVRIRGIALRARAVRLRRSARVGAGATCSLMSAP